MKNNKTTKGIILAGGSGTRLHPVTRVVSKQLLPIYNQPMIYYPLSTLIKSGIKDILIITTPQDEVLFKRLLDTENDWGAKISFKVQDKPEGIAQAFLIAENWLDGSQSILILGDNLFFGPNLNKIINKSCLENIGATIFGYKVNNPNRFGVIEFDKKKRVLSIEEKPKNPKSNWAATGLYIFNNDVVNRTKKLRKSSRGELEITDLNNTYLNEEKLNVVTLDENYYWLDTGTHESLLEASNIAKKIQDKYGKESIGLM
jgi:glucose-1-phosphate thymidylyltransferase